MATFWKLISVVMLKRLWYAHNFHGDLSEKANDIWSKIRFLECTYLSAPSSGLKVFFNMYLNCFEVDFREFRNKLSQSTKTISMETRNQQKVFVIKKSVLTYATTTSQIAKVIKNFTPFNSLETKRCVTTSSSDPFNKNLYGRSVVCHTFHKILQRIFLTMEQPLFIVENST